VQLALRVCQARLDDTMRAVSLKLCLAWTYVQVAHQAHSAAIAMTLVLYLFETGKAVVSLLA
jgi:hypothetical protein